MIFLLDTNVVSELRKAPGNARGVLKANARVLAWVRKQSTVACWLSCVTILEVETGVLRMERRDPEQGAVLRGWLEKQLLPAFASRILPVDLPVARMCATLQVPDPCSYRDSLIAATALVHKMTVVTRNTADFEATGVPLLNPWES